MKTYRTSCKYSAQNIYSREILIKTYYHFLCQNPSLYYSNQQLKRLYKKYFYEDKENESNQIQEDYDISIFSDDTEMNDLNSENYTEAKTSFKPEESPFNFTIEEKVILGMKTINLFKLH